MVSYVVYDREAGRRRLVSAQRRSCAVDERRERDEEEEALRGPRAMHQLQRGPAAPAPRAVLLLGGEGEAWEEATYAAALSAIH